MKQGTTSTGFAYEIPDEKLDNWELLELLSEVDDGNEGAVVKVVKELFEPEQLKNLKSHVKSVDGSVTISGMVREIGEILNGDEKN